MYILGVKNHQKPWFVPFHFSKFLNLNCYCRGSTQDQRFSLVIIHIYFECTHHELQFEVLLGMFQVNLFSGQKGQLFVLTFLLFLDALCQDFDTPIV